MCFLNCNTKYNANSGMIFFFSPKAGGRQKVKKKKKSKSARADYCSMMNRLALMLHTHLLWLRPKILQLHNGY